MKKAIHFLIALLLCLAILGVGMTVYAADEYEEETDAATTEETGATDIEIPTDEEPSVWEKFWEAVIGAINGQNAREAVQIVCSVLAAVIAVLLRSMVNKTLSRIGTLVNKNGEKTNELIAATNENGAGIEKLPDVFKEFAVSLGGQFGAVEKAVYDTAATEKDKNTKIDLTCETVIALADMMMTIYQSSSTIPDAAKDIMREKYARVLHSVNAAEFGDGIGPADETEAENGDQT